MEQPVKYAYFPGCAAHSTARDQDQSTRSLFESLDIGFSELDDWNCCGATPGHTIGGSLGLVLSLNNLCIASDTGHDLVVPCASCYGNLKAAQKVASTQNIRLLPGCEDIELPAKSIDVVSIVSVLSKPELINKIKEKRRTTLSGLSIAPYYGCLLLRPEKHTDVIDVENPMEMEAVVEACGAVAVSWPHKTDCCGGPNTVGHPETVSALSGKLVQKARQFGAEAIVTACPMCHTSLDAVQWEQRRADAANGRPPLPILYLTELVAAAIGVEKQRRWLKRHLIDPRPLLKSKGALK